eukprot:5277616-Pleurochrysis_carterae.AAC.1
MASRRERGMGGRARRTAFRHRTRAARQSAAGGGGCASHPGQQRRGGRVPQPRFLPAELALH